MVSCSRVAGVFRAACCPRLPVRTRLFLASSAPSNCRPAPLVLGCPTAAALHRRIEIHAALYGQQASEESEPGNGTPHTQPTNAGCPSACLYSWCCSKISCFKQSNAICTQASHPGKATTKGGVRVRRRDMSNEQAKKESDIQLQNQIPITQSCD